VAATENVFLSTLRDVSRGLDVIEDALKVASSGDLTQVPFPLVGRDAQIHLDARKGAYLHVLEMCSAESLKKWLAQEQMAVPDERAVLAKLREAAEGLDVIEVALKACTNGDLSQAPFPLCGQEARIHLDAQGGAYLHALEMCSAESVQELLANFIDEQRLEELKALGFDSESEYQIHRRVINASRALGAKLKADSMAAGSTAFDHPEGRFEIEAGPDEVESAMSASNPMRSFEYQLLGRLQQDCEYYLGAGGQNKRHLWALDEIQQIQKMKELYHDLPVKPVWITLEEIKEYEEKMVSTFGKPNAQETERGGKVTNSRGREPNQVYETGSDDTCWYSKVIREGECFNVRVYDADGDRRLDREDSFADQTLAAAFADKSVLRLSDRESSNYTEQPGAKLLITATPAELALIRAAVENYLDLVSSPASADRSANGDDWADREVQACHALLQSKLQLIPSQSREAAEGPQDFTVRFEVSITAASAEEAANLALDDLRDTSLGPWSADVVDSRGGLREVSAEQADPRDNYPTPGM